MRSFSTARGPFFDYKALRARAGYLASNAELRRAPCSVPQLLSLHDRHAALARAADDLRAARNAQARARAPGAGAPPLLPLPLPPPAPTEPRALKERLAAAEAEAAEARRALEEAALALPCDTHPAAPLGNESQARVLGMLGAPRAFAFPPRDHLALGAALGLFDFEASAAASGAGFVTLKGPGVALELALVQWALARTAAAGFTVLAPPDAALAGLVEGCGFNPRDASGVASQVYSLAGTPLCLVGTAEIPLAALHAAQTLALPPQREGAPAPPPLLYAAWGRCFRREAGGAGAATRGLYRLHQFTKVEMFAYVVPGGVGEGGSGGSGSGSGSGSGWAALRAPATFHAPDIAAALLAPLPPSSRNDGTGDAEGAGYVPALCPASETLFARLVDVQVSLLAELGLCARVLDMPSEELGGSAFRKVDCEVWMPGGGGRWGEVSSASNCMDYQSRRLGMRYKCGSGAGARAGFLHTLNATAAAVPRLMLSILETHQTAEGCVEIPPCLQPYMGGVSVLRPVQGAGAEAGRASSAAFGVKW